MAIASDAEDRLAEFRTYALDSDPVALQLLGVIRQQLTSVDLSNVFLLGVSMTQGFYQAFVPRPLAKCVTSI